MVSTIPCQNCGARLDANYGRVFGAGDGTVYACSNCSTHRAVARGAATAPEHDGTPMSHRPSGTEPVAAVLEDEHAEAEEAAPVLLTTLRGNDRTASNPGAHTIDDEAFAELVAE